MQAWRDRWDGKVQVELSPHLDSTSARICESTLHENDLLMIRSMRGAQAGIAECGLPVVIHTLMSWHARLIGGWAATSLAEAQTPPSTDRPASRPGNPQTYSTNIHYATLHMQRRRSGSGPAGFCASPPLPLRFTCTPQQCPQLFHHTVKRPDNYWFCYYNEHLTRHLVKSYAQSIVQQCH